MPLFFHKKLAPKGELGLWKIEEPEDWFRQRLQLTTEELAQFEMMKGNRRREWLACRWLLHHMSGREIRGACLKDEFGKPYLEDSPYQIAISHSHDMAAVVAAPRPVGVDIQFLVEKIERIAHKYMREAEFASLRSETRLEQLHVYWGAKESLYKAYGRRMLDFKGHIHIEPFEYDLAGGLCKGRILKEDFRSDYNLRYERIGNYILVMAMEEGEGEV